MLEKYGLVSRREFGWKFGRESSLGSSLEFGWVHALEEVSTISHLQNFENKNGRFPDEKKIQEKLTAETPLQ